MASSSSIPHDPRAEAVLALLRSQRESMVKLLEALALAESPSNEPRLQRIIFELLASELRQLDMRIIRVRGTTVGDHLLARPANRQRGERTQLIVGHLDTVYPGGTLQQMPVSVRGGKVFGPGVLDMKGGLVQLLFALRAVRTLMRDTTDSTRWPADVLTPVVWIASDEEIGSPESRRWLIRLARVASRVFVVEPALGIEGKLKSSRKGTGRFTLVVHGKAAHAGLDPDRGASAILELSHQIQRLFAMNDPARGVLVNVGVIEGGQAANIIAPRAQALVEVRMSSLQDAHRLEQNIRNLMPVTPGTRLEVTGGISRPPLEFTAGNQALWKRAALAAGELNIVLDHASVGGASDGNLTSLTTPTLDGLGAVGDGAHASHEFVFIDRMIERAALLAMLLMQPA